MLAAFEVAKASFVRLQANEGPLKSLVNTYKLGIPASFASRLEAKGFKTLTDVRVAGGTEELARRLKLKPDDDHLTTITAHANLSFLGSDIPTNSVLIKNGYTHLSGIANEPDGIFVDKVGSTIGFAEALGVQKIAKAQTAVFDNYQVRLRTDLANGFAVDSVSDKFGRGIKELQPPCDCKDCDAAVSRTGIPG